MKTPYIRLAFGLDLEERSLEAHQGDLRVLEARFRNRGLVTRLYFRKATAVLEVEGLKEAPTLLHGLAIYRWINLSREGGQS